MDRWIVLILRMYIIFGTCNTKHRILLTSIITTFMHVLLVIVANDSRSVGSADEFFTGDGSPAAVHRLLTGMCA